LGVLLEQELVDPLSLLDLPLVPGELLLGDGGAQRACGDLPVELLQLARGEVALNAHSSRRRS
jgi:hypothetical protein